MWDSTTNRVDIVILGALSAKIPRQEMLRCSDGLGLLIFTMAVVFSHAWVRLGLIEKSTALHGLGDGAYSTATCTGTAIGGHDLLVSNWIVAFTFKATCMHYSCLSLAAASQV